MLKYIFIFICLFYAVWWKSNKNSADLVILVISKRENFNHRTSIRSTWWKDVDLLADRVIKYFVISENYCPLHSAKRIDEFSCDEQPSSLIKQNEKLSQFVLNTENGLSHLQEKNLIYNAFIFKANEDFQLIGLALLNCSFANNLNLTINVELVEPVSQTVLGFVKINRYSPLKDYHFWEKINFLIKKGMILEIRSILPTTFHKCDHYKMQLETSTITYLNVLDEDFTKLFIFSKNSVIMPSIIFSQIPLDQSNISLKENLYNQEQKELDKKIKAESELNEDILYVRGVDTYRNLPSKVLQAFQIVSRLNQPYFTMKVDDDTYLNIKAFQQNFNFNKDAKWTWFGSFRKNWAVNLYGKWAEHLYQSVVYPPFACGSAYMITGDILNWLSYNAEFLKKYQGEDVSMGIWLAALNLNYTHDSRWNNENNENLKLNFGINPVSPEEMLQIHRQINQIPNN